MEIPIKVYRNQEDRHNSMKNQLKRGISSQCVAYVAIIEVKDDKPSHLGTATMQDFWNKI